MHKKPDNSKTLISVIMQEPDLINLRLQEAFFIRKLQPTINSRAELTELNKLYFELNELLFWIIVFLLYFSIV